MKISIDNTLVGKTVKEILYDHLSFSSNMVKRLKSMEDGILVNGKHVTVRYVLSKNDSLTLKTEDAYNESSDAVFPCNIPIDIVYEDEYIIAIDKRSGMPTHPSHNHREDSLANALSYYYASKDRNFVFRAINRLDSDTSGIVLIAKDKNTAFRLSQTMSSGGFTKKYAALVFGDIEHGGTINKSIRRCTDSTMLREVCNFDAVGAKNALTEFKILKKYDGHTLLELTPVTGRTHQLRVHMSSIGHPICGDGLYGHGDDTRVFYPRLALHAYFLEFRHPITNATIKLVSSYNTAETIINHFGISILKERQN